MSNRYAYELASENGHLHILEWLQSQSYYYKWAEDTCMYATRYGHLHILQWLYTKCSLYEWNNNICAEIAVNYGHFHILKWLSDSIGMHFTQHELSPNMLRRTNSTYHTILSYEEKDELND